MIVRRAPGKLFVAGEYAVIEPGHPAVIVAVDRYSTATVTETSTPGETTLSSDLSGGVILRCLRVGGRLIPLSSDAVVRGSFTYVLSAVGVVERLLAERGLPTRSFRLAVTSDLIDADGRKLGLGSSAAVTVATIAALGAFYRLDLRPMDRYRLAMLATLEVAPRASGGDVAASTWGGWIAYSAPDRQWLAELVPDRGIATALDVRWPGLTLRALPAPHCLRLRVGWTGQPASTTALVAGLRRGGRENRYYPDFLADSTDCVRRLITAFEHRDPAGVQREIRRARWVLTDFDSSARLGIMTPRLEALCAAAEAVGAAAKPSGAGGGDCGIALIHRQAHTETTALVQRWAQAGIRPLPLRIHPTEAEKP
ncbi:phosphomevalonate kinase [Nocardia sp. NPDC057030]|uniref:phosphomevalonate kinase n=1 Tax=unclassified Nocardia TaxID=2637762 RepID=UPI003640FAD2